MTLPDGTSSVSSRHVPAFVQAAEIAGGEAPRVSLERSLGYGLVQARRRPKRRRADGLGVVAVVEPPLP